MMDRRRALMGVAEGGAEYDGIPVFVDNANYTNNNGKINGYVTRADSFLTMISGDYATGKYTFGYSVAVPIGADASSPYIMRYWNAIDPTTETSSDYWRIYGSTPRALNFSNPKTQVYPVIYEYAKYFFVQDPNGNYLIKGSAVE